MKPDDAMNCKPSFSGGWEPIEIRQAKLRKFEEHKKLLLERKFFCKIEAFKKTDDYRQLETMAKKCGEVLAALIEELGKFSEASHQDPEKILRVIFTGQACAGRRTKKNKTSIKGYLIENLHSIEGSIAAYRLGVERLKKEQEAILKRTDLITKLNLSDEDRNILGLK